MCRLLSFDDLSAQVDSSSRQSGLTRFGGFSRCASALTFPKTPARCTPYHIFMPAAVLQSASTWTCCGPSPGCLHGSKQHCIASRRTAWSPGLFSVSGLCAVPHNPCTWRRLPEEPSEAPGSLTTFADIATRQEQEQEDHEGLHSTVRLHITSAWLLAQCFSMTFDDGRHILHTLAAPC